MYTCCTIVYNILYIDKIYLHSLYNYVQYVYNLFLTMYMKQIRLSQSNIELLDKIGLLTSDQMNSHINKLLKTNVHECTQPQKENESIIPLLLRLVQAQEHIAKNTGCVVPTHPVNESSDKTPDWMKTWVFDLIGTSIKLPQTSVQWIWIPNEKAPSSLNYETPAMTIEELYWWPKKPERRELTPKQSERVLDLFNETVANISSDWDRESPSWSTRDVSLVYKSIGWRDNLYDQYMRMVQTWLLQDWEHKAHLFQF